MKDQRKTETQRMEELQQSRQRLAELETRQDAGERMEGLRMTRAILKDLYETSGISARLSRNLLASAPNRPWAASIEVSHEI